MFPKNVYVDTGPSAETRAQSALRMVVPPMDPLLGSKPLFGGTDSQRPRRSSPVTLNGSSTNSTAHPPWPRDILVQPMLAFLCSVNESTCVSRTLSPLLVLHRLFVHPF